MISIIIPTYNEADHIERTLQNLLTLKEQPIEILVADGGSTDDTIALASKYARVIYSGKGKGLQLNTAAKEAAGEILFFVHADMHGHQVLCLPLKNIFMQKDTTAVDFSMYFPNTMKK